MKQKSKKINLLTRHTVYSLQLYYIVLLRGRFANRRVVLETESDK